MLKRGVRVQNRLTGALGTIVRMDRSNGCAYVLTDCWLRSSPGYRVVYIECRVALRDLLVV